MPNNLPPSNNNNGDNALHYMLGKIDGKLDTFIKRQDEHELRIGKIESELGDRHQYKRRFHDVETKVDKHGDELLQIRTTAANMKLLGVVVWALFGLAVTAALAKAFGIVAA